jgi:hypothetical protein
MKFATAQQGEHAGQLVRLPIAAPAILQQDYAPPNPYTSGYGRKIPTRYMVRTIDQRWRRVYCVQWSNAGSLYIVQNGECVIVEFDAQDATRGAK